MLAASFAEVALDAANEAFNASAGRLRKLYAAQQTCLMFGCGIGKSSWDNPLVESEDLALLSGLQVEKLAGNCLQKVTFEQVPLLGDGAVAVPKWREQQCQSCIKVERSQNTEDGFQKIREAFPNQPSDLCPFHLNPTKYGGLAGKR